MKDYNLNVNYSKLWKISLFLLFTIISCKPHDTIYSKSLESKLNKIDEDQCFSLDTLQEGHWDHLYIATPYINLDSLLINNHIVYINSEVSKLRTLINLDNVNSLLFVKNDTLMKIEIVSRSIMDFSDINKGSSSSFAPNDRFKVGKSKKVEICLDSILL